MAYKLFKPRRGKKSYMDDSDIVLAKGELFFETPEDGVGTGACKVKMGDGSTTYANLPYALGDSSSGGGEYEITDNTEPTPLYDDDGNLITARSFYYGSPTFNDSHEYDSDTTFYAPTEPGEEGQFLVSNGEGEPSWQNVDSVTTSNAIIYYSISDDDSTTDKNIEVDDFKLTIGSLIIVTFSTEVTPGATLNVSSTGSIPLYHMGRPIRVNQIQEGATAVFLFDGSHYDLLITDTEAGGDYIYADEDTDEYGVQPDKAGAEEVIIPLSEKIVTLADSGNSGTYNVYYGISEDDSTTAKTAEIDGFELEVSTLVNIKFTTGASAGATLNINGTGETEIYHMGRPIKRYTIQDGATCMFVYDGTNYLLLSCDTEAGSDYIDEDPLLDIDFGRLSEYSTSPEGG